jgi:hypothetical protein
MRKVIACAAVILTAAVAASSAQAAFSDYGLQSVSTGISTTQAGAHPDFKVGFHLKTDPNAPITSAGEHRLYALPRDFDIGLPPGLIGNPHAVKQCTSQQFFGGIESEEAEGCPFAAQIGISKIVTSAGIYTEPIFNIVPPPDAPAQLGVYAGPFPVLINVGVRSDGDYGLNSQIEGVATIAEVFSAETTIWGVPASPAHDTERLTLYEAASLKVHSPPRPLEGPELPFLQNPTHCGEVQKVFVESDSYQEPGRFSRLEATLPALAGCGSLVFQPEFEVTPTTHEASAPSGLNVELRQVQDESVAGRATAQLRDATVEFPAGMTLAAGAAEGLSACSDAQVGYKVSPPPASACPPASKLGTAEFEVPQLPRTIEGAIYQRTPVEGDLFRIWLVSDELGIHVKIPGDIRLDHNTGQVTSLFVDNPQVPLANLKLHIFGGPRGPFATPSTCGTYETRYEFVPWSGTLAVTGVAPMTIDESCSAGGFSPGFNAGTANPTAGAFSPFVLQILRQSSEQNLSGLEMTLPEGVLAKLKGVPLCPEQDTVAAACPAASQVGEAKVASGPGPSPLWLPQLGREPIGIFLAGPYKGAPYSLLVRARAQAGPFDLGTVVVRQALYVNPETAQVTVKSDPLPQILEGVPVTYRTIYATINRPDFTLNPTSCQTKQINATLLASGGKSANATARFQAASCASLAFKPNLKLTFSGQTKRTGYPAVKAVLTQPAGENANIGTTTVILPKGMLVANAHINNPCTRVQFNSTPVAGEGCPAKSILGSAKVSTPLLENPEEGKVYFRSNGGERQLPDLVIALRGPVPLQLVGFIDSVGKKGAEVRRVRVRFLGVPDAPVSRFELKMLGGKRGLLQNSENLCKAEDKAKLQLSGQNGKTHDTEPKVQVSCGKGGGKK